MFTGQPWMVKFSTNKYLTTNAGVSIYLSNYLFIYLSIYLSN